MAEEIEKREMELPESSSPGTADGGLLDEILSVCGDTHNQGAYVKAI